MTIPFQLAALQNLTPTDRTAFQRFGTGPTIPPRNNQIHQAIEAWSTNHPHETAVEHLNTAITYGELNHQADRLAATLIDLGVRPGDRVGLFLTRSIPMVVGILAVLKARAAYVPQDIRITPPQHLRHIIQTANIHIILTTTDHIADLPPNLATVLPIDPMITATPTTRADDARNTPTDHAGNTPLNNSPTTPADSTPTTPADPAPATPVGRAPTTAPDTDTDTSTGTGTGTGTGEPGSVVDGEPGWAVGGQPGWVPMPMPTQMPTSIAVPTQMSTVPMVPISMPTVPPSTPTVPISTPMVAISTPMVAAQSSVVEGRDLERGVPMPGPSPVHDSKTRNERRPPQSSKNDHPTRAKGPFARTAPQTPSSTQVETQASEDRQPGTPDVAMVIFTSGTTGQPNGVQVTHANLCNVLLTEPGSLGIRPGTRVAQLLNIAFDMAAWEILGTLANGGTLVIRDDDIQRTASQVHVVIATPSVLAEVDPDACPDIHTVAVAGERCPAALAEVWSERAAFHNSCGPTEVTIVNTMYRCLPGAAPNIGQPLPNTTVYILDDELRPCPIGEVGEMWAGGACVTAGYVGNPKLTAERYRPDPFLGGDHVMFRTRDLGRWTWDGHLEHHGRTDDQVKVRGFRVELDAVTNALERSPGCARASTVLHEGRLVGFVSPATVSPDLVRETIVERLPYYCVPTLIVPVNRLPVTDRGKVDRRALLSTLESTETVA